MTLPNMLLKKEEQVIFRLRALFEQYGYKHFKMSKFEEYDFYAENRDFLSSENILTFSGLDGKLLALKPDVTLSIVKNARVEKDVPERVYYNENVYRARKGAKEYKEIMQVGLEYIGEVDAYATIEVISLAQESLEMISNEAIMDLSHMGFVAGLLEELTLSVKQKNRILNCIRQKNPHSIQELCDEFGVDKEAENQLIRIASLYGPLQETLAEARTLAVNPQMKQALDELEGIYMCLKSWGKEGGLRLDFSIVNDLDYYNGIIFKGYIKGVANSILSGGRYDNLVHKMGKKADAIGFAVYLDLLEGFEAEEKSFDTDILLLYEDGVETMALIKAVQMLTDNGKSVIVQKKNNGDISYRQLLAMKDRGLEIIEEQN